MRLCLPPARRREAGRPAIHAISGAGLFQYRGKGLGALRPYLCRGGEAAAGRPMGEAELAVLDRFEEVTKRPELMLEFTLRPGEMYFINNYTILPARTAFEDFEEQDRRRHLLRLWLEVPQMRPVHPHIQSRGDGAVPGRKPSYDWSKLTKNRN